MVPGPICKPVGVPLTQLETSFETLLYEEDDGVAVVTLNRPDVHNAFDQQMQTELHQLWRALREHDPVHWDPYMHAWVVTSYPEVVTVLMNYSADRTPPPAYLDRLGL